MTLPDCMMPDGADPCRGYHELHAENERLQLEVHLRREIMKIDEERVAEIERLKVALGPGATAAWEHLHDEVKRLEDAVATCRELRKYDQKENVQLKAAIAHVRQRSQRACEILNEFENTREDETQ